MSRRETATKGTVAQVLDSVANMCANRQPVNSILTALAAVATTGLVSRTGAGTVAARTLTGTASKITVTNGDGVAGNPTVTIPDAVALVAPDLTAATPAPTYGSELAPAIGTWTGASGATYNAPNWVIPSGGTISTSISVVSGTMYQIEMTRTGSSDGLMTATLDGASTAIPADGNTKFTLTPTVTGTTTLTIGGGTWVCTTLSAVTVKAVTALASARTSGVVTRSLTTNNALGLDAQYSLTTGSSNSAVGYGAQRSLTTGNYNSAVGQDAQRSLTTGSGNNAVGQDTQRSLTTGNYNSAVGYGAQYSLTTGSGNNAVGQDTQRSLTTGSRNNALGSGALRSLTTGSKNNALGSDAGNTDGITATIATAEYTTMLGHRAQATVSNVCVIGSAIAAERQTLCLGNYNALGSNVRGGVALTNAQTVPTTNPTGGGILYAEAGALKWRGSTGTVTTIANA